MKNGNIFYNEISKWNIHHEWGGGLEWSTVEPQFNKPLYNEVLSITNSFLQPGQNYSKCMEQNLDITNLDLTKSSLWRTQSTSANINLPRYSK